MEFYHSRNVLHGLASASPRTLLMCTTEYLAVFERALTD